MDTATAPRPAALAVEGLEARDNPAGNVNVFFTADGVLNVYGDADTNQVSIQQNQAGDIIVYGYNGTTVNGAPAVYLGTGIPNGLFVDMSYGDDYVDTAGLRVYGNLYVGGSFGNDTINLINTFTGGTVFADGGEGNDSIAINGVSAGYQLWIDGGNGFDTLDFNAGTAAYGVHGRNLEQVV